MTRILLKNGEENAYSHQIVCQFRKDSNSDYKYFGANAPEIPCYGRTGMVDDYKDRGRKRILKTELVTSMKESIDGDWRLTVKDITQ